MTITDTLYDFQRAAVEFVASRPGAALLCEQGTGKTHVVGALVERLMTGDRSEHLIVVLLANVETTWVRLLGQIAGLTVCRDWSSFKAATGHRLLLLHYEAFRGVGVVGKIVKRHWTSVTFDESQRLKQRGSKASRAAARFSDVDHRVVLSGTPIEQAPQDLWAQLRFAAPACLGTSWTAFDTRWLRPCGFMGYDREFLWDKLSELRTLIQPVVFRVLKADVLELPPIRYVVSRVHLLGDQARIYRELDDDRTSVLIDGRRVICDMEVTELVRLQQVVGGFVRADDGESVVVGRAKERRLRHLLSAERRAVIFCKFIEEIETCRRVAASMFSRVEVITGKTRKTRAATVDAFQAGEIDVLVCQVRTGGVGINLHAASVAIFYSTPYSYIDFDQAVCRLHRHGQLHEVRIILLQAVNTVDEIIHAALLVKRTVSERTLDTPRRIKMAKSTDTKSPEKPKTSAEAPKEKAKPTPPPQPPKPKYGVPELAEAMNVKATSLRVRLRSAGIPKNKGKVYGWDTKAEMQEIIDKLKTTKSKASKDAPAGD